MGDITKIIMKFERFMILNRQNRQMRLPKKGDPGKIIGYFTYDFENKTETFTPTEEYKKKTNYK